MRIFLCSLFLLLTTSPHLWAGEDAKRLVALVDYIGGDYRNAVESGKIVNQLEYDEMLEFSRRSLKIFKQLKASEGRRDPAGIEKELRMMASHIEQKSGDKIVPELAQQIKDRLIATYKIITYPKALPDLEPAKVVYIQNCAQCHGETGRGNGPSAETMQPKEPKPADFTNAELMSGLSPFKAFNTTTFGIEGTAMPDFSALEESERWQAAFYIFSLRFSADEAAAGKKIFEARRLPEGLKTPKMLATLSDGELLARFRSDLPQEEARKVLAYLRRGLLGEEASDPLVFARSALAQALKLYREGATESAYQKSVEAYLDGFELAEPTLFARDPAFARALEAQFAEFRAAIKRRDPFAKIQDLYTEIETGLARASESLSARESLSGPYVFLNSAVIILREGVEAALIVAAIIALLKSLGAVQATRYVHIGWALALLAGFATWALAQTILTIGGSQRETIEGLTTLTAAVVLFYVSYWLIANTEAKRWQRFIREKIQHSLDKKRVLALVGVSFFAVYREAFETVLFYQALWLQSTAAESLVVWGFLAGLAMLLIVVFTIFRLGLKIPLRKFFGGTSVLLFLLAFVFAGEGIRELQTAGWLPVTPVGFPPSIGPLGIYPTVESLLTQGAMLVALLGAVAWLSRDYWLQAK